MNATWKSPPAGHAGRESNGNWQIEIVTPDGASLRPQATLVELATLDGQIGVMPGHERLVTALDIGELVIHSGRQRKVYLVGGGFARVQPGRLSVLAFSLEQATNGDALKKCRARRQEFLDDDVATPDALAECACHCAWGQ
jgi:F-type H+-transporting ATPase subunit epsilon